MRVRDESVAWNEVDGNVVVLDLESSTYFSTNTTGTVLWHLLVPGASRSELVTALVERFEVDADAAGRDVDAFVAELERVKLLEPGR